MKSTKTQLLENIKELTAKGFRIFPVKMGEKTPLIKNFANRATSDFDAAKALFYDDGLERYMNHNIGIYTGSFKDGALIAVDIDKKPDKNGLTALRELSKEGKTLPNTYSQFTPSGGMHLLYYNKEAVKQGANVLGAGVDIRSSGGYIVASGSQVAAGHYTIRTQGEIKQAPLWLVKACGRPHEKISREQKPASELDKPLNVKRCIQYLENEEPAFEGKGGDEHTFRVCARIKDFGVSENKGVDLLLKHWNPRCVPTWSTNELYQKMKNAYVYGLRIAGDIAAENEFDKVVDPLTDKKDDFKNVAEASGGPIIEMSREYAFIVLGGKSAILHKNGVGSEDLFMTTTAFHDLNRAHKLLFDSKSHYISKLWMESPIRPTYKKMELLPLKEAPLGVYNLWKGFSVKPAKKATATMTRGLDMFYGHMFENICDCDLSLHEWLMDYMAHMIQKPYEKPQVALVLRGEKGVGKNVFVDMFGSLLENHYLLTSSRRYVLSNFNGHMARLIFFVLDEAFWSGDKQAEGILKDLITGREVIIEKKNYEAFTTKNLMRICILGNENWIVPATEDERRFAVLNVSNKRKQDTKYFTRISQLMRKGGGLRLLLKDLQERDISDFNLNVAPITEGLLEQKVQSLDIVAEWWLESLKEGRLKGYDLTWPRSVHKDSFLEVFKTYANEKRGRRWVPSTTQILARLVSVCPLASEDYFMIDKVRERRIILPKLAVARTLFEEKIGHRIKWLEDDDVFG